MGCKKLTYITENPYPMRVIWNSQENKNLVQECPPDPLTHLYPNLSPYVFVANNPILFKDEDGRVIVDANGNPVTTVVSEGGTTKATATFKFAEGTSQDVMNQFNSNGGKIINTLIQVKTGNEQVNKAIESNDKIHLSITTEVKKDAAGNVTLGRTKEKAGIVKDASGQPVGVESIIDVKIFQGSIDELNKPLSPDRIPGARQQEFTDNNLNNDQKIGSIAGHELEHATNPVDVGALKTGKNITNKQHEIATGKGTQVAKEFGDQNKK